MSKQKSSCKENGGNAKNPWKAVRLFAIVSVFSGAHELPSVGYVARLGASPERSLGNPVIGRWGVADPMAEMYTSFSPYSYVGSNPIVFHDPTGMYWVDSGGNIIIDDANEIANFLGYLNNNSGASINNTLMPKMGLVGCWMR
ncbi:hypothetical protein [Parapedobacter tibetensis]|uniref:hypothetical protein n=1 Tax=Parapedobacter tibetensis TaxID=2972951 RepID=UPI00214D861F|nr:hypothetical protein [Parapedobacter tibetensis]